jgi:DNA-directed RNA polymerase subunit RPC12/RpoP
MKGVVLFKRFSYDCPTCGDPIITPAGNRRGPCDKCRSRSRMMERARRPATQLSFFGAVVEVRR